MNSISTRFASALVAVVALFNVAAHAATFTESSPEAFAAANAAAGAQAQRCDAVFIPGPQSAEVIAAYPAGHVFESQCLVAGAIAPVPERPATFRAEGSNVDVVLPMYFHFEPSPQATPQAGEVIGYPVTFRAEGSNVDVVLPMYFHFEPSLQATPKAGEVIGYPTTFRATGSDVVQILTPAFHFYPAARAG